MAGRGPSRTPTALLLARGSNKADGRVGTEPSFTISGTIAPEHLIDVALDKWNDLAPYLADAGVLSHVSRDTLAAYCETWASYIELLAAVHDEGWTLTSETGDYKNPKAMLLGDIRTALLRFQQELGLTPAARSRVKVDKAKDNKNSIQNLVKVG